ncbi:MAG: 5'/3'-nucleotidase SurE, partial [Pseudanabaena sp.]
ANFAKKMVQAIATYPLEEPILLNVNIPAIAEEDICGAVITRLGIRRYRDQFEKRIDPRGKTYYWLSGVIIEEEAESDTDIQAIRDNYITITPLKYDLTCAAAIPFMQTWTEKLITLSK